MTERREMEESPPGRSPFQVNSDKSHLVMENKGAFPETFNLSPSTNGEHSMFHRWPATEVYKPCSVPYSKDTMERYRNVGLNPSVDLRGLMWNDYNLPGRRVQNGSGVCPFGKFLSVAAVISSLLSFLMMLYFAMAQKWAKVSIPNHEYLSEGYLLLIQSATVVTFTTFVAIIILYHGPVTRRLYLGIICGLMFMCISDQIWFWHEILHKHDYNSSGKEVLAFTKEFTSYFAENFNGTKNSVAVPAWMHQIQISHKCCGSNGPEDWLFYLNGFNIPDSCCVTPTPGCGFGYFADEEFHLMPSITVFDEGCAASESRLSYLTYGDLMLIQFAKFSESFIMLFLFIVLNACCKQGFVSTEEDIQARRRRPVQLKKPYNPPHASSVLAYSTDANINMPSGSQN